MEHLTAIMAAMECELEPQDYPTHMDGVHGWKCVVWSGCLQDRQVVHCHGTYGHDYPFHNRYIEGVTIMWDFMKTQARTPTSSRAE